MRRTTPLNMTGVEPHACSLDLRLKILRGVPFFADLKTDALHAINPLFHEHGYAADETIYVTGDLADRLFLVADGKVKLIRHTLRGQDVMLELLMQGELFGSLSALGDEVYADTAQAQTNCCVLAIAAADFQTILKRYPAAALRVLNVVAGRLKVAHETVKQLSAYSVEQRIASTLLHLADRLGKSQAGGLVIQTPLSRQDLAAMTGTTTETVSRVISHFRHDGLIRSGRQWIAITDRIGLEAIADEHSN